MVIELMEEALQTRQAKAEEGAAATAAVRMVLPITARTARMVATVAARHAADQPVTAVMVEPALVRPGLQEAEEPEAPMPSLAEQAEMALSGK